MVPGLIGGLARIARPLLVGGFVFVWGEPAAAQAVGDFQVRTLLQPRHEAVLSAELAGRIEHMPLREGDRFNAGDLLVAFDCALYRAELAAAGADRLAAQKRLENNRQLAALNSIGALEVELAAAEADKAAAEVRIRQIRVDRCRVQAPYAGRVVATKVNEGESVAPGDEILEILDDRSLELKLLVPSPWLSWLKPGTRFSLVIDETGREYPAEVTRLGARIDPVSQTVPVTAQVRRRAPELMAGMSGTARFEAPSEATE